MTTEDRPLRSDDGREARLAEIHRHHGDDRICSMRNDECFLLAEVDRLREINHRLCSDYNSQLGQLARAAARLAELGESEWVVPTPALLRDLPIRDLTFEIERRVTDEAFADVLRRSS